MEGGELLDDVTIREFLIASYPRIVAAIALTTGSREVAEDAVQEALARAWERSAHGDTIESLPAWVTKVAINLSRSRFRRMRIESRAVDDLAKRDRTAHSDDAPEDRVAIEGAIRALPVRQREVTVLRYYLGMSVSELAVTLGVSEGTVKTSLHRARGSLAAQLGESIDEEVPDDAASR